MSHVAGKAGPATPLRGAALALSPLLLVAALDSAAGSPRRADRIRVLDDAVARWDIPTAAWEAARLLEEHGKDPEALLAAARVAFHQGDYERTRELGERARAAASPGSEEHQLAAATIEHLASLSRTSGEFSEVRSAHFVLRVTPRDRILVPHALEALENSAAAMDRLLGYCPTEPVLVEVHPTRRSFVAASSLTAEEVETSRTIAICHFNRIMIISPAATSRGYDWLDTLCHEYVHYAVYRTSEDTVPVWLHEGIAKSLESAWRVEPPEGLDPRLSSTLAEGLETGQWVAFERMHPSMAKLPSARLVSLAFAEVAAGVMMILDQGGAAAVQSLVTALRDGGGDLDAALSATFGADLGEFESRVRRHAAAMPLYRIPGARFLAGDDDDDPVGIEFADEAGGQADPEAEARKLADKAARDWTILGDRLKGRQHFEAAVIEYDKALAQIGHSDPMVVNKKAHAMIVGGRPAEALPSLEAILRDYPTLTTTLDNLSEANLRLASQQGGARSPAGRAHLEAAADFAHASERINPFSSDTQLRLAAALESLGRDVAAERARERLQALLELQRQ